MNMEQNELEILNINKNEEHTKEKEKDLDVLNLNEQDRTVSYGKLEGTGVKTLRIFSAILIVLGVILFLVGIFQIADSNSYHPERMNIGLLCISGALTFFVISPIYKVLAIIGEAAKIYKDKNVN